MSKTGESALTTLLKEAKTYLELNVENVKLTAAEKTVKLLSMLALVGLIAFFGLLALVFISLAIGGFIASAIGAGWAFVIVCGAYLIMMMLVIVFRNQLVINPVSRFITKLFLS
ncbi:MAG: phage holin family protein [Muribaculaceae bacterium]|nr:phage holin family protein [Muribaculaceae bacterium]